MTRNKTIYPLPQLPFSVIVEVPAKGTRQGKEIKRIQIGKEGAKLSVCSDDMTVYVENPKKSTKKKL